MVSSLCRTEGPFLLSWIKKLPKQGGKKTFLVGKGYQPTWIQGWSRQRCPDNRWPGSFSRQPSMKIWSLILEIATLFLLLIKSLASSETCRQSEWWNSGSFLRVFRRVLSSVRSQNGSLKKKWKQQRDNLSLIELWCALTWRQERGRQLKTDTNIWATAW